MALAAPLRAGSRTLTLSTLSPSIGVGDVFPTLLLRNVDDRDVTLNAVSTVIVLYRGHW